MGVSRGIAIFGMDEAFRAVQAFIYASRPLIERNELPPEERAMIAGGITKARILLAELDHAYSTSAECPDHALKQLKSDFLELERLMEKANPSSPQPTAASVAPDGLSAYLSEKRRKATRANASRTRTSFRLPFLFELATRP